MKRIEVVISFVLLYPTYRTCFKGFGPPIFLRIGIPPLTPTKEHQQISVCWVLMKSNAAPGLADWQTHNQQWQTRNTTNREHSIIDHVEHV